MKPKIPENESQRQAALDSYGILDTLTETEYDDVVKLAALICGVPMAVISFVDRDRQWFKATVGLDAKETPREISFCGHAILGQDLLVVEDAKQDQRFSDNPLVAAENGIRFYAGAPLVNPTGLSLGTICVIDQKPRHLSKAQLDGLQSLARQVMTLLQLRSAHQSEVRLRHLKIEAESEVVATRDFLQQILQRLPIGIFCKDSKNDFRFTLWNEKVAEITGISAADAIGSDDKHMMPDKAEQFRLGDIQCLATGKPTPLIDGIFDSSSGRKYVNSLKVPILDRDGSPRYILGITEDVTARKMSEMVLLQTARLTSLGEMAAGVAHEINNPLAIIQGHAQNLLYALESDDVDIDSLKKNIGKIDATATRIARIISGLRSIARDGENEPFLPVPVSTLLQDSVELCRARFRNYGVELVVPNISPDVTLECRAVQISQVLMNLLNNAFEAVGSSVEKRVTIEFKIHEDNFEIAVTDTGAGIPPDLATKIMTPFFTTKSVGKGLGLGLSISKTIAEGHKGRLWIDISHRHTRFVLRLPSRQEAQTPSAA
jgi:PAS domain S-box-containing protein